MKSDFDFVIQHYFREASPCSKVIPVHEYYAQRQLITDFFGYSLWSGSIIPHIDVLTAQIVRRDITPGFVTTELIPIIIEIA